MNKKVITTVIVLAVIVLGGYLLLGNSPSSYQSQSSAQNQDSTGQTSTDNQTASSQTEQQPANEQSQAEPQKKENVVTYTDNGYFPSTITIKSGDTVTWKNQSSNSMWTASAVHPSHTLYSGTSLDAHCPDTANTAFDECAGVEPGGSWSFTFKKKGAWKYHNHLSPGDIGTVIVQ